MAAPIPAELRSALADYVSMLRRDPGLADRWRWTDAGAWHVTLAFLGATDRAAVPAITDAIAQVASASEPFTLAGGGLGAFPASKRARVLWYGIADSDGRLGDLARTLQPALGLEPETRFRGHLTLARARDRRGTDASAVLAGPSPPEGAIPLERLILNRSHLGQGPARYEELASVPLGGASS